MEDYIEISSDSNETIITDGPITFNQEIIFNKHFNTSNDVGTSGTKNNVCDQNEFFDDLIDLPLIKRAKKININLNTANTVTEDGYRKQNDIEHSLKTFNDTGYDTIQKLRNKYVSSTSNSNSNSTDFSSNLESIEVQDHYNKINTDVLCYTSENHSDNDNHVSEELSSTQEIIQKPRAQIKRKINEISVAEKEKKREDAELKKNLKKLEKEKKKEMLQQQKEIKNAIKTVQQSLRPDECIKHMTVEIDPEITGESYGEALKEILKNSDVSFKSTPQIISNIMSWSRKVQSIDNLLLKETDIREKSFLLILDSKEFKEHVHDNSLVNHISYICTLAKINQLTVALFGIERVKREEDFAITEAQLLTNCYFRYVKNVQDLGALVMELTKAIAQIPYKQKKEEKYKLQSEYFNDSNKDTVRVDKNGNGLGRLWHQMLTMFPLARLETAEAVTSVYPTPTSLFEAYKECNVNKVELLQDLTIRRAQGPLTSVRRLGPEFSRKCYNFFCSPENVLL